MIFVTTGQVIFYSGVGLLIFTIVLGVAFWLKKPQYIPGNAAYDQGADKNTRKLRSGYPTDHLTVRREPEQPIMSGTAILQESTAQLEICLLYTSFAYGDRYLLMNIGDSRIYERKKALRQLRCV